MIRHQHEYINNMIRCKIYTVSPSFVNSSNLVKLSCKIIEEKYFNKYWYVIDAFVEKGFKSAGLAIDAAYKCLITKNHKASQVLSLWEVTLLANALDF